MSKDSRAGEKYSGSHTSLIPAARNTQRDCRKELAVDGDAPVNSIFSRMPRTIDKATYYIIILSA